MSMSVNGVWEWVCLTMSVNASWCVYDPMFVNVPSVFVPMSVNVYVCVCVSVSKCVNTSEYILCVFVNVPE